MNYFERSYRNKNLIKSSKWAACYHCADYFRASAVKDWCDGGHTAICPSCHVDSVIGDYGEALPDKNGLIEISRKAFMGLSFLD